MAVHCVRPTGKQQAAPISAVGLDVVDDMSEMTAASARRLSELEAALSEAEATVVRLQDEVEAASEAHLQAMDDARRLLEEQNAEAERWRRLPRDEVAILRAWVDVLTPLESRLRALHEGGHVECAVLGFVRSDAEAWRRFWLRRKDPGSDGSPTAGGWGALTSPANSQGCGGPHAHPRSRRSPVMQRGLALQHASRTGTPPPVIECVGCLGLPCRCALCEHRGGESDRSGAYESLGQDGLFVHAGMGTRVSGVVRVRASSPAAGMEWLCGQLVGALHAAKGPLTGVHADADWARTQDSALHGLYDVSWQGAQHFSHLTHTASRLDAALTPGGPPGHIDRADGFGGVLSARQTSPGLARPCTPPQAAASPRGGGASRSSPRLTSPRRSDSHTATRAAGGERSGSVAVDEGAARTARPFLSNPHSALMLDVQMRLLRTSGTSFSYVSGRSQSDGGLVCARAASLFAPL